MSTQRVVRKTTVVENDQRLVKEVTKRMRESTRLRKKLQATVMKTIANVRKMMVDRTLTDEDMFTELYNRHKLLVPPYNPGRLYKIAEESSILPKNIGAMIDNIPGFGYEFVWKRGGTAPTDSPEKEMIESICLQANESQSLRTVRREVRRDAETTGNGYYEVVRTDGGYLLLYRARSLHLRMTPPGDPAPVTVPVQRGKTIVNVEMKKRFRKFAYASETSGKILRWFKEFGDPRGMDPATGEYIDGGPATEIIHFTVDGKSVSPYGIPRWIGCVKTVLGASSADFVNYDLFGSQGIPPFVVMVSGGILTADSIEELEAVLADWQGVDKFNRVAILEAEDMGGEIDQMNRTRIDIKSLSEFRKEDAMFGEYLDRADKIVRQAFRLPPLFTGSSEEYTFATAKTSRLIAEEQVFKPERQTEDELFNTTIFRDIADWEMKTKGPEIIRSDELVNLFIQMVQGGALTIDGAIAIANKLFDLNLTAFDEPWSTHPILIINALAKVGRLAVPPELLNEEEPEPPAGGPKDTNLVDEPSEEVEEKKKIMIVAQALKGLEILGPLIDGLSRDELQNPELWQSLSEAVAKEERNA